MRDPTRDAFAAEAKAVLARLPLAFREQLDDVVLRVEEFASPEQLAAVGLSDRWEFRALSGHSGSP